VAAALVVGLGAAAYFTFGRGSAGPSPSPTPSLDIHSKEAVMAAIKHYYDVEALARKTGNADLIDSVTIGHASLASQNFHAYVADQAAKGHRSVILESYFADTAIQVSSETATASFTFWLKGHDTDATTGRAVELDNLSRKSHYRMTLQLVQGHWLVVERDLLFQDAA
jgi:hypothetical protein